MCKFITGVMSYKPLAKICKFVWDMHHFVVDAASVHEVARRSIMQELTKILHHRGHLCVSLLPARCLTNFRRSSCTFIWVMHHFCRRSGLGAQSGSKGASIIQELTKILQHRGHLCVSSSPVCCLTIFLRSSCTFTCVCTTFCR